MGTLPHFYQNDRTLTVKLSGEVSAALARLRRELRPGMTDEEFAAWLLSDSLIRLAVLDLPKEDRGA